MNHKRIKTTKLFRKYDGMFVYVKISSFSNKGEIVETNDPIEAYLNHKYNLYRYIDTDNGEWVNVGVEIKLSVHE